MIINYITVSDGSGDDGNGGDGSGGGGSGGGGSGGGGSGGGGGDVMFNEIEYKVNCCLYG